MSDAFGETVKWIVLAMGVTYALVMIWTKFGGGRKVNYLMEVEVAGSNPAGPSGP